MSTNAQEPITDSASRTDDITPSATPAAASGPTTTPDAAAPAVYAVLAGGARPAHFGINEAAFTRWCDDLGEQLESELPEPIEEHPAGRLSLFVDNAVREGVIEPVPGLQLDVYGDDSDDVSGFYVMLSNTGGTQQHLFITTGWNELYLGAEGTDPREVARDHLETVCHLANTVIDGLYPHRVTGADTATNILTIEQSDGSCATWLLTDQRAELATEAITARCGPPDSQLC